MTKRFEPGPAARRAAAGLRGLLETPAMMAVLASLVVLALSACATSAPTRYFAPEALGPESAAPAGSSGMAYRGPAIALRSVTIPPAMDRLEMVRESAPGQLTLREFAHWAAPLTRLARQTLTEDLARRLPADRVLFPGTANTAADALLSVDVLSFHLIDGSATMTLSWSTRWPASTSAPADPRVVRTAQLSAPAGDDAEALARAWSVLLAQAADRIVADLTAR